MCASMKRICLTMSGVENKLRLITCWKSFVAMQTRKRYITCWNIRELKTSAIRVEKQKNISLKNISFSSSFFSGKLHLPPLVLNDSTVSTLLNLLAYEMCPLFKNEFEICSYLKFLDLLTDYPDCLKEIRSSGILQNSLGSNDQVVELLNTISSGLVHNPTLYSGLKHEVEKHYKKRLGMWIALHIIDIFQHHGAPLRK
ncbi:hypothetical protein L6164_007707 [Bauhinia variegata]|uniref:Uncharacterized protein n=1 Tax=Bauhinia variegata TaxID=167791 RepID=A0ACB9PE91_BAUVA|nr:hypothetical protein L6164_007707 [Bauhinia variegata]